MEQSNHLFFSISQCRRTQSYIRKSKVSVKLHFIKVIALSYIAWLPGDLLGHGEVKVYSTKKKKLKELRGLRIAVSLAGVRICVYMSS